MKRILFLTLFTFLTFGLFSQVNVKKNYTAPWFVGNVRVGDTLGVGGELIVSDTIETNKGYKFPDGSFQITAAAGAGSDSDFVRIRVDTIGAFIGTKINISDTLNLLNKIILSNGQFIGAANGGSRIDLRGLSSDSLTYITTDNGVGVTPLILLGMSGGQKFAFLSLSSTRKLAFNEGAGVNVELANSSSEKIMMSAGSMQFFHGTKFNFINGKVGINELLPTEWLEVGGNIGADTIKLDNSLQIKGVTADSIIPATSFTGNLGNSTTGADTLFSSVARIGDATNYTEIQSDGTVTLVGTARVLLERCYNPSQFDISAGTPAAIGVLTNTAALLFDATTQEHASITFEVPHEIDLTVNPVLTLHIIPVSAQSVGSSFVFQAEMRYIAATEAINKAVDETLNSGAITVSNSAFVLTEHDITLNASLMAAGDHVSIGLDRLTVDANDDRNGDAGIMLLEFAYTVDKLGE